MQVESARGRVEILAGVAAGAGLAICFLPAASWGTQGRAGALITSVAAIGIATTLAVQVTSMVPRRRLTWLGAGLVGVSALLVAVTPRGVITCAIAVVTGVGAGLVSPRARPWRARGAWLGLVGALAVGAILLVAAGATAALWFATILTVAVALVTIVTCPSPSRETRRLGRLSLGVCVGATAWAVLLTGWVGANTPDVSWFGATVSHGPRNANLVALTFDDGPDATYTLAVRDILDAHGVKGTFFTVGKALDARPDISKALLDDGQLLGDHSYHHDGWRWLDPRYPELQRTQNAFERDLGVCPAFYRPPHGQRTPFISWLVHDRGMTTVTWDVSANDWASHNAAKVASDVLARVKAGSIILLHDGLDGKVHADRSVLLGALPRILDGLKAKGLQPVRLDELLDKPGYVPC